MAKSSRQKQKLLQILRMLMEKTDENHGLTVAQIIEELEDMGIPAEHADAAYSVVETLLRELMALKGAADYTGEVNSILSLYEIATGTEEFTEDDIAELVSYGIESDAIFNTLVSISTCSAEELGLKQ